MSLLREKLAELLFHQSWYNIPIDAMPYEQIPNGLKELYLERADEIIALFVGAIKNLEFNPNTPSKLS